MKSETRTTWVFALLTVPAVLAALAWTHPATTGELVADVRSAVAGGSSSAGQQRSSSSEHPSSSLEHRSAADGWAATFSERPTESHDRDVLPGIDDTTVMTDTAGVVTYSGDPGTLALLADGVQTEDGLVGSARQMGGTLLSSAPTTVAGEPALGGVIETDRMPGTTVRVVALGHRDRPFLLITFGLSQHDHRAFLDSFHFTD